MRAQIGPSAIGWAWYRMMMRLTGLHPKPVRPPAHQAAMPTVPYSSASYGMAQAIMPTAIIRGQVDKERWRSNLPSHGMGFTGRE